MKDRVIHFLGVLFYGIALSVVLSLPVMLLWNFVLIEVIPGILPVTWLQAWGLYILSSLLFKNSVKKEH